jgi:two-component system nitrogen regulation response regulator GlnG
MGKVFIVEDSKMQAFLLEKVLLREGYSVRVFYNGNDLIEILEEEMPSLIISDIEMPDIGGFELLENLREKSNREIPFLFISSHYDMPTIKKGRLLGADSLIKKPFNVEERLKTKRRFLN